MEIGSVRYDINLVPAGVIGVRKEIVRDNEVKREPLIVESVGGIDEHKGRMLDVFG